MKKILLTLSLVAMMFVAGAQIVVTGIMADPFGTDAHATDNTNLGFEYAQFKATKNIDFSLTPYAVVFLYETTTTPLPDNGWASGSQGLTYQFNLTSGSVSKGEFFYVGGEAKKLWGASSADISSSKWIRARDYAKNLDDSGVGNTKTGLLGNSSRANGIAVFMGVNVTSASVPVDVIFFGQAGSNHYSAGPPEKGFRIANTDFYATSNGEYFNKSTNTGVISVVAADLGKFVKLGGVYDLDSETWVTPRSASLVTLSNSSVLADIEAGSGVTVLPVSLTNFTAKANKQGIVNLTWATAAEQNNSHFDVTRSTDGQTFTKIGEVLGSGTINTANHYNFTDESPISGLNYYQLKQVDKDGNSTLSKVVSVKLGLSQNQVSASLAENGASVKVNYNAQVAGPATFTIYNLSGAKLANLTHAVNLGSNQLTIPVQLKKSVYLLQVQQGGVVTSIKF